MKKFSLKSGFTALTLLMVLVISVGISFAYFTDYDHQLGKAKISLSGQTELEEEFKDTKKIVSIKNTGVEGENADCVVKLLIYGPEKMEVSLGTPEDWTPIEMEDGAYGYYYNKVLAPGESTSKVTANIANIPKDVDMSDFEIIVLQESKTFEIGDDGNVIAPDGWTGFPTIKA